MTQRNFLVTCRKCEGNCESSREKLTDIGVVDLCEEADLGWRHGVLLGKEELELEDTV